MSLAARLPASPGLLVSVRSAAEALAAVLGGAAVVDVKEPDRGPLGMADPEIWQGVREAVPGVIPVSVALGDLGDWRGRPAPDRSHFDGLAFRKIGLAGAGRGWVEEWRDLREAWGDGPPWVAVIYADWTLAGSPRPDAVIEAAAEASCAGVLIDTWGKGRPCPIDATWLGRVREIRERVGLVAMAGGLDEPAIARLGPLGPDLFAVRGAACAGGDRRGAIDADRVAALARACEAARPIRDPMPQGRSGA